MVQSGMCYNGCCRFQTCMNGGTCIELCGTPKEKFKCFCGPTYSGKMCKTQLPIYSCLDILKVAPTGTTPPNGIYEMIDHKNAFRKVYCAFVGSKQAWTLIESFSRDNAFLKNKAFHQKAGRNHNTPGWESYRLGLQLLRYIRTKATMFRATCDFPNRGGVLTPDYLFGYLSDYDIINRGNVIGECMKFAHMNVRGYDYFNVSAKVWHHEDSYHLVIDCSRACPGFPGVPNSVPSEDCFGYYGNYNNISKCTSTAQSTTQWWLGEEL